MTLFSKKNITILLAILVCAICLVITFVPSFSATFDSLVDGAVEAGENVGGGAYKVINVFAPAALLIILIIILFSHDSKKVSYFVGAGIVIAVAWIASMAIHSGWIGDFLKSIGEKYFNVSKGL